MLKYKQFLEKSTYHSIDDVNKLVREIKDFTYNNDAKSTDYFKSVKEIEDGFIVDFNVDGDKTYKITNKKVTDGGVEISTDEAYYYLDMLFNMIQTFLYSFNIQQMDESKNNLDYMKNIKNYNEFIKENIVNEDLVWFRGFNKESDNFMDLLDGVLAGNKDGFCEAVNSFVLQISRGDRPNPDTFMQVITEKFYEEYYKIGLERGIGYDFEGFKEELIRKGANTIFPKMLYKAVMSDMTNDGGSGLLQYTSGEAKEYLSGLSVERGKEKLGVMLKNKGIIKEGYAETRPPNSEKIETGMFVNVSSEIDVRRPSSTRLKVVSIEDRESIPAYIRSVTLENGSVYSGDMLFYPSFEENI